VVLENWRRDASVSAEDDRRGAGEGGNEIYQRGVSVSSVSSHSLTFTSLFRSILAARLQRIDELQMNPGEEKFARISGSLQLAAFAGRLDSIKWFLRKHSPIDEYDSKGFSALHYAADKGFNE
jgi:hypothetical protein